jgi:hypothetical protein
MPTSCRRKQTGLLMAAVTASPVLLVLLMRY